MHREVGPFLGRIPAQVARLVGASVVAIVMAFLTVHAQIPGRNVNMVAGDTWPNGDPYLQRQNEVTIAGSTRNPLHLLAGANDYRTVDIPGLPGDEVGDAWLGLYKSTDGGQRWTSTLLPGYPQDTSQLGLPPSARSPLFGYQAGADPIVRAGTNGLFYYAGLTFDRTPDGKSAIFVARFIDNNNQEAGDPVAHIGTRLVAKNTGAGGAFLDKPWMAVDIPRDPSRHCRIQTPGKSRPITQRIHAGNVYVAYALKTQDALGSRFDIYFSSSTDCGVTFSTPVRISRTEDRINQGVTIAIEPANGMVHIAWRRFDLSPTGTDDAMMVSRFDPARRHHHPPCFVRLLRRHHRPHHIDWSRLFRRGGFHQALEAAELSPFDQGTSAPDLSFRTNAYPTLAIDSTGRVYMAWTERGFGVVNPSDTQGDTRILLSTSPDGVTWRDPRVVSETGQQGHQIMPSMSIAGGKLMLVYYDLREDRSGVFSKYVDDKTSILQAPGRRHTIDVRVSMATPAAVPVFGPSVRVSDYIFGAKSKNEPVQQLQVNAPNLPIFMKGTAPFIGDYIDLTPAPVFVRNRQGEWTYNVRATATPPIFHAAWTDNRDVRVPFDGDWTKYSPPNVVNGRPSVFDPTQTVEACVPGQSRAGSRNQNVYTARITGGLHVGSPGNSKPLSPNLQRAFVVFAQNTTTDVKTFRMRITGQPPGGRASFEQFPLPPYTAASRAPLISIDVTTPPRSTASRTVYVTSSDPHATVKVTVAEITGIGDAEVPNGLTGVIVLNPDVDNPALENPDVDNPDVDNPDIDNAEIMTPDVDNPDVDNPDVDNPDVENPDVDNRDVDNIRVANPDVDNADVANPDVDNPDVDNPDVDNPDVDNPDVDNGSITDVTWRVTNNGNTTSAYNINLFLTTAQTDMPQGIALQLIIHKTYKTPVSQECDLKTITQNILYANIPNPEVVAPDGSGISEPNDPDARHASLWLAPGERGRVTLRILDQDRSNNVIVNGASIDSRLVPEEDVTLVLQAQPVDTPLARAGITEPPLITVGSNLVAFLGEPFSFVAGAPGPVTVRVTTANGAAVVGTNVTLSMGANPTDAVLSGAGTVATNVLGLARFPAVSLDKAGAGYTLIATPAAADVEPVTSQPFAVYEFCVASGKASVQHYVIDKSSPPNGPKFIVSGVDFDRDNLEDVAIVTEGHVLYTMHNFIGGFQLQSSATGTGEIGTPTGVAAGDFSGDGFADVVMSTGSSNSIRLFPLAAGAPSGPQTEIIVGGLANDVVAGHFNADELLDVAVLRADAIGVMFGDGEGAFPSTFEITGLTAPRHLATDDMNGDGNADLIFSDAVGPVGRIQVYLGDGLGAFVPAPAEPQANVGDTPNSLVVHDFNRDGHMDVATANIGSGDVSVLLGNGSGAFQPSITVALGFAAAGLTAGDFNSDGRGDLAATQTATDTVTYWFGQGGSPFSFGNPRAFAVGDEPAGIATGDFNNDGRADVAIANMATGNPFTTMSVMLGSCGVETADLQLAASGPSGPVAAGDDVTYVVTVTNHGPFTAQGVVVSQDAGGVPEPTDLDAITSHGSCTLNPVVCTVGDLASSETATMTIAYRTSSSAAAIIVSSTAVSATLDPAPADNTTTIVTPLDQLSLSGEVSDSRGDSNGVEGGDDLISASVTIHGANVHLSVRFAEGTFDQDLTSIQFMFDTDQNPATGHPGNNSGCVEDNGIIGVEHVVSFGSVVYEGAATVLRHTEGCNNFEGAGTAGPVTFVADGADVTIPLALLGGDDGRMSFKVASSRYLPRLGGFTGILDYMTNIGQAPGNVGPPR